jgi:hypothetical protein
MSAFPSNWPLAATGHYLRYRKAASNKGPWEIAGPFFGERASVDQTMAFVATNGMTTTAQERVLLPVGSDVKNDDVLLSIERQQTYTVVASNYEAFYTEVYLKSTDRQNNAPALFAGPPPV